MNKQDLIDAVAKASNTRKYDVEATLEALAVVTHDALAKGDEVTLPCIGKLKVNQRKGRTGRNPRTGEAIEIAPKKQVTLTVAKALADAVNA